MRRGRCCGAGEGAGSPTAWRKPALNGTPACRGAPARPRHGSPAPPLPPRTLRPHWPAWLVHVVDWVRERPWLGLVVVVVLLLAVQVAVLAVARWRQTRLTSHAHLVTITPPPEV